MAPSRRTFSAALALVALGRCHGQKFTVGDQEFDHEWRTAATMPTKRSDLTATTVGDEIYLIGGCSSDQEWSTGANMYLCAGLSKKVERFQPLTKSWGGSVADAPRSRYRHAAVAMAKRIYLFGGRDIADNLITEVDVLDTSTGTWSTLQTPMPNATSDLSAFMHAGKIYVLGGYTASYDASTAMMMFDPLESGEAAWTSGPPLKMGRGDAFAVVARSIAYVVGGFHHSNWEAPMKQVERFDPATPWGGWQSRAGLTLARGDKAVAVLHDVVHVAGGETKNVAGHSVPVMDVEAYDPDKDQWYAAGNIPSQRFRFVAASHGDSIFIFGGQGQLVGVHGSGGSKYPVLNIVEEYHEMVSVLTVSAAAHQAVNWIAVASAISMTLVLR